jgi:hypothetical protein
VSHEVFCRQLYKIDRVPEVGPELPGDEAFEPQTAVGRQEIGAPLEKLSSLREDLEGFGCPACLDESICQIVAYDQNDIGVEWPLQCAVQDGDSLRVLTFGDVYICSAYNSSHNPILLAE